MTLQADESASAGTKQGQIKSQVFTEINGNQVKWDDLLFNISIASSSGSSTEASSLMVSKIELKTGNSQEATINLISLMSFCQKVSVLPRKIMEN